MTELAPERTRSTSVPPPTVVPPTTAPSSPVPLPKAPTGPTPQTAQQQKVQQDKAASAKTLSTSAKKALLKRCKEIGIKPKELDLIREHIRKAEVTVNFKAYKEIAAKPLPTLLKEGGVKSFFETGASDGSNDFGGREQVERDMFGYTEVTRDSPLAERAERPKYAASNALGSGNGGADISSYGQSALVLNESVKSRSTITHNDSFGVKKAEFVGTFDDLDHVLLQKFQGDSGAKWAQMVLAHAQGKREGTEKMGYLEVQVHDTLDVERDVAYVRANFNEAFGTANGEALRAMAGTKPVIWGIMDTADQMILQPDKGPAKAHFDAAWDTVKQARQDRVDGKVLTAEGVARPPINTGARSPEMTAFWNELIALMPPANIYATGSAKGAKVDNTQLPQLVGGADPKKREKITAAQVKALFGGGAMDDTSPPSTA